MSRSSNEALCLTLRLGIDTTSFRSSDTGRCRALSDQSVCPILYLISLRGTCQSRQHCLIGSPLYPEMGADLRGSVASLITSWRGRALKGIIAVGRKSSRKGPAGDRAFCLAQKWRWRTFTARAYRLRCGLAPPVVAPPAPPAPPPAPPPACASAKVLVRAKAVAKAIAVSFMFMFLVV